MSWLYYLLEANLYLVLFYGFYKITLQKDTFFKLNRFYLITSSVLALVFPFIQLGFLKKPILILNDLIVQPSASEPQYSDILPLQEVKQDFLTADHIVFAIYILVAFSLLIKLILTIKNIVKIKNLPSTTLENGVELIELKNSKMAFSFFNSIFLDPHLPDRHTIIKHELAHINQKHSFDVLFFEILQIVNWFNPILHSLKKDVKLIHEYLADEETTKAEIERYPYAMFLIQNSVGFQNFKLTNQIFSSSILKKRITMLNQKKSANWARLKMLILLPLISGVLALSTMAFTKDYGVLDLYSHALVKQDTIKANSIIEGLTILDEGTKFTLTFRYNDLLKKGMPVSKKLFIVNGKSIESGSIGGVENADYFIDLDSENGMKKYGKKAEFGAVEAVGKNIKILNVPSPPPPGKPID